MYKRFWAHHRVSKKQQNTRLWMIPYAALVPNYIATTNPANTHPKKKKQKSNRPCRGETERKSERIVHRTRREPKHTWNKRLSSSWSWQSNLLLDFFSLYIFIIIINVVCAVCIGGINHARALFIFIFIWFIQFLSVKYFRPIFPSANPHCACCSLLSDFVFVFSFFFCYFRRIALHTMRIVHFSVNAEWCCCSYSGGNCLYIWPLDVVPRSLSNLNKLN